MMKNSLLDDEEVLGNRASYQQEEGDYYGFDGANKDATGSQQHGGGGDTSGADPFGFNSFVAKKFLAGQGGAPTAVPTGGTSAAKTADPFSGAPKQMFSNIEVNVYTPKDPNALHEGFKVIDVLEDDPDTMERQTYHVSKVQLCKGLDLSHSFLLCSIFDYYTRILTPRSRKSE